MYITNNKEDEETLNESSVVGSSGYVNLWLFTVNDNFTVKFH